LFPYVFQVAFARPKVTASQHLVTPQTGPLIARAGVHGRTWYVTAVVPPVFGFTEQTETAFPINQPVGHNVRWRR
jgi:hypothetical protein